LRNPKDDCHRSDRGSGNIMAALKTSNSVEKDGKKGGTRLFGNRIAVLV